MLFRHVLLALLIHLLPFSTMAAEGLLFGPEWTFTGPGVIDSPSINAASWQTLQKLAKQLMAKCGSCQISTLFPEIDIRINQDIAISLSLDNRVIEINAKPMTISTMNANKELLQELIWNSAQEIGLRPHLRLGGGHLHIQKPYQPELNPVMTVQRPYSWIHRLIDNARDFEYSSMQESPDILLMRNFIVDLWNRPGLFLGALGFNLRSAKPLSSYSSTALEMIQRKVMEFDRGEIGMESLIRYHNTLLAPSGDSRNLAINLDHARTIEIRGLRPQQSFFDYLKICQLFEDRILALAQQTPRTAIKLDIPLIKTWSSQIEGQTLFFSSMTDEEVSREFRNYIESANQDWERYKHLPLPSPQEQRNQATLIATGPLRCVNLF